MGDFTSTPENIHLCLGPVLVVRMLLLVSNGERTGVLLTTPQHSGQLHSKESSSPIASSATAAGDVD